MDEEKGLLQKKLEERMEKPQYESKGYMIFVSGMHGVKRYTVEKAEVLKPYNGEDFCNQFSDTIYDLMTGEDFLEHVDDGGFIDYDGNIKKIYVDGYISNLGLHHKGISQGDFLVTGGVFSAICKEHEVEVSWVNR